MANFLRFSIFGDYETLSTNNTERYVKLIELFSREQYIPATTNEIKLSSNGQPCAFIMPCFSKGNDINVEITTSRINFFISSIENLDVICDRFANEMSGLIKDFTTDLDIKSNRIAINCNMEFTHTENKEQAPKAIKEAQIVESKNRKLYRTFINQEMCNVIIEKTDNVSENTVSYSYDINTLAENSSFRFNRSNYTEMLNAMSSIALALNDERDDIK